MKLRNKKTGEIERACPIYVQNCGEFNSLAELNDEWEDYKPDEPLIKDEKIRKAVRAWAEAHDIPNNFPLEVFEYLGSGSTGIRYNYEAKTKPYKRCVTFEYISSDEIYNCQNDRICTIAELCGGKE